MYFGPESTDLQAAAPALVGGHPHEHQALVSVEISRKGQDPRFRDELGLARTAIYHDEFLRLAAQFQFWVSLFLPRIEARFIRDLEEAKLVPMY
jgi:hypothetical protein